MSDTSDAYEAAQRVEKFLNTRRVMTGIDPELIAQVGSRVSNGDLVDLTVSDLRILLAKVYDATDESW